MRTIVFIDGQNLYHAAKGAWASVNTIYNWPSYDVEKLSNALVTRTSGRVLSQIRFYTGVPNPASGVRQKFWSGFWQNKFRSFQNNVYVYTGRVSRAGQEKGVDVSIAIDLVRLTYEQKYDVAIIVSQDSDFRPAVSLARAVTKAQGRSLEFESAFPSRKDGNKRGRGIPGTTWVQIDKATYDSCLDPRDYRPRR